MTIVNTTTLRNNLADTLSEVNKNKKYLLVANKGKITSAVVNIGFFEDLLELADKNHLNSIKKAREEYEKGEYLSHDKVFGDL